MCRTIHLVATTILLLVSCTTVKRHNKVVGVEVVPAAKTPKVTMELFGTKVDAAAETDPSKSLWDLQAEGQAELIKSLNGRYAENEKFSAILNEKYLKPKEKAVSDYTAKDLKLIFSIAKNRDYKVLSNDNRNFTLADRIEYLKFKITIPTTLPLVFVKWNKYATEYATVDVADMTFSNSFEVAGSLGQSTSVTNEKTTEDAGKVTNVGSLTPSVSGKGTFSRTETQKVRYRYLQLNGSINEKEIRIEEEGMREIDLSGNVAADISLKFDETTQTLVQVSGYKSAAGAFQTPNLLKASLREVLVPILNRLPATIDATLEYEYAYRHVEKKDETFYEWDDQVKYFTGTVTKTIPILKQRDYLPGFYQIAKVGEDALAAGNRTRLVLLDNVTTSSYELLFATKSAADEFWDWLLKYQPAAGQSGSPIVIERYQLMLRSGGADTPLTKAGVSGITANTQPLPYYR